MTQISPAPLVLGGADRERIGAPTRDRVLIGLAAGGVALPPLVDLLWNGWERVFGYFADAGVDSAPPPGSGQGGRGI